MALSRRRKISAVGAAVAAFGGLSFCAQAFAAGPSAAPHTGTASDPAAATSTAHPAAASGTAVRHTAGSHAAGSHAAASHMATPHVIEQPVASGRVDGVKWSVKLQYYPTLPPGYTYEPFPGQGNAPEPTSLLCQRMYTGGVLIDHQGGPWADCQPLVGAHDPAGSGNEGLWGTKDKGLDGSRLFVANPGGDVAYGVVTLTDGTRLTARSVTVPHTDYHSWAVAIPDGHTIATVDQYDARHHLVSHETDWR